MMKKTCKNCRYADVRIQDKPCPICFELYGRTKWEPGVVTKKCMSCKHRKVLIDGKPCYACGDTSNMWEPAESTDVMITVLNGCVEVEHKPPGVIVRVRDYDTDGVDGDLQEDEYGTYTLYEW